MDLSLSLSLRRSSHPTWVNLPAEVTADILHRLGAIEILESAQLVCMTWRNICKDPSMWRSINMQKHGEIYKTKYDVLQMCQNAVERSCGGLEKIVIHYFATEKLLHYIADRAPKLKSLQVAFGYTTTKKGLGEVAEKLLNLEELHIFFTSMPVDAFESFGRSCPRLKSFTYSIEGSLYTYINDESDSKALAIAETMPGLCYLNLFGSRMTKKGLHAILDGCPQLETLDIRQCFNVDLSWFEGRICTCRIKNLRRPNDSTDGYEFDVTILGCRWYPPSEYGKACGWR